MAYHFAEVGYRLVGVARVDIVVGEGVVPIFLRTPVDGVALHVAYHVLGVVHFVLLNIAFGEPCLCLAIDGRLGFVKTTHVGESRGGCLEIALEKLGASHQHPCFP